MSAVCQVTGRKGEGGEAVMAKCTDVRPVVKLRSTAA